MGCKTLIKIHFFPWTPSPLDKQSRYTSHNKVGMIVLWVLGWGGDSVPQWKRAGGWGGKGESDASSQGQCSEPASGAAQGGSHHPLSWPSRSLRLREVTYLGSPRRPDVRVMSFPLPAACWGPKGRGTCISCLSVFPHVLSVPQHLSLSHAVFRYI